MAAVTICSDFGAQKNSLSLSPLFPHLFAMKWWDQMPWSWFSVSFKPTFSLSFFTFNKRLFSSSSLSAIGWFHMHIWGYCYFSWQSWFQLVLHAAWHFTWYTLCISEIRVTINNFDAFLSLFGTSLFHVQFSSNCWFLTCIQISQETGQLIWYSHLFKNFPQFIVIHTQSKALAKSIKK